MRPPPSLIGLIAFLVGFWMALALFSPSGRADDPADPLLTAVNALRREHNLRSLDLRADLSRIASAHARDMLERGYLSHVTPEGLDPLERAQRAGLEGFRLFAENIGETTVVPDPHREVVRAWLRSPAHRENLLHPAFNATGVGEVHAGGRTIYVQLYAAY